MQAISTKYIPPTSTRAERCKATCATGSVSVPWDHKLSLEDNHKFAAAHLVAENNRVCQDTSWGLPGDWVCGASPTGGGEYFHVYDDGRLQALRGLREMFREGSQAGNPWAKRPFQTAVLAIGRALGYFGGCSLTAPTNEAEAQALRDAGKLR